MKKWPLLDSNREWLGGDPRIDGTRLSTEGVYKFCAGSDSDAHVKMFQEGWPYVTAKQIKQGSRSRGSAGESENANSAIGLADVLGYRIRTLKAATLIGAA